MGVADDYPHRFRISLGWAVAQQLLVMWGMYGLVGGGMVALGLLPVPGRLRLLVLSFTLGVMTATTVLMIALLSRRLTVRVGPAGLAVARLVGRPVLVGWDDITAARPLTVLLVPRLLLTVRGHRRPLAVPLRLDDPGGFAEAVAAHAGGDHPLAVALHERLADD